MKPSRKPRLRKPHPLVGTWVSGEDFDDVAITVSRAGSKFRVSVIDTFDDEQAEVYDVKWDGRTLTYAAHWESTGRFVKARLQALSDGAIDYCYTYSKQETWHRKPSEK